MKRIYFLLATSMILAPSLARSQDAATEERFNQLNGKIEDLIAGQEAQKKLISELRHEIETLRDQQNKPSGDYASRDDFKRLAETVKEVDRKRLEDADRTKATLDRLAKMIADKSGPVRPPRNERPEKSETDLPKHDEKGFEYTIKSGDTLSTIVKAYKEQNIKITSDQILKANPGLQPEKLRIGQKIFIPAPAQ